MLWTKMRSAGALILLAMLVGCATQPVRNSGFLGDAATYAKLAQPGRAVEKLWVAPDADFKRYDKFMLDEVVFYLDPKAESQAVKPGDIKELTKYYHEAFTQELGRGLLVAEPAPGVARIKIAIVDIEPSNPALDTVTTVLPVGLAVSLVKSGTGSGGTGVGHSSIEFQILDSQTGKLLALGRDTQIGSKLNLSAKTDKWGYAKAAFHYWARSLKKAIEDIKAGKYQP